MKSFLIVVLIRIKSQRRGPQIVNNFHLEYIKSFPTILKISNIYLIKRVLAIVKVLALALKRTTKNSFKRNILTFKTSQKKIAEKYHLCQSLRNCKLTQFTAAFLTQAQIKLLILCNHVKIERGIQNVSYFTKLKITKVSIQEIRSYPYRRARTLQAKAIPSASTPIKTFSSPMRNWI